MATIDSTRFVKPFDDFKDAYEVWPRGDRLEAIRTAAVSFKQRFREQKQILGVRTYELIAAPYPTKLAFAGATISLTPFVSLMPARRGDSVRGLRGRAQDARVAAHDSGRVARGAVLRA